MFRSLLAAAVVPLFVAPAGAAPIPGAKPVSLPVPADALVVVQINGVEKARGRLQKMLAAAAPDVAPAAAGQFDQFLATTLDGRDLKAVTPDARAFVVVTGFEPAGTGPAVAVLVPVKDYATFREKLLTEVERKGFKKGGKGVDSADTGEATTYFVDLTARGYVAVTKSDETAALFAGNFAPVPAGGMGAGVAEAFLGADVGVYVRMDKVNERYGDKIKQGRQLAQLMMQQGGAAAPGLDKRQLDMMREVYDGLFQAAEDSTAFAAGLDFRPEGLALRLETGFAPDSAAAKALAAENPGKFPGLGRLPTGLAVYMASKLGGDFSTRMAKMNRVFQAEDGDDKAAAVVEKFLDQVVAAQAGGIVLGATVPSLSLAEMTPKDAAGYVAAQTKALTALTAGARFGNVVIKNKPAVKEAAGTVGKFTFTEARVDLDFDATVKNIADANLRDTTIASMKRFAREKNTFWYGTDGTRVLQVTAPDWAAAAKVVGDYLGGTAAVGDQPAFRASRGQLPADAGMVVLAEVGASTRGLASLFADLSETIPGFPGGKLPKLSPAATDPAYVGLAVGLQAGTVRADVFVPVGAVPVVRKLVAPLMQKKDD